MLHLKNIVRVVSLLCILFTYNNVYSQTYTRNYTTADGLPTNSTRKIYKDSRGYIWIGTDAGVARFDGKKFEIFNTLDGLAGDQIWGITEDKEHNLWFGCYDGGITKYDGKTFKNYTTKEGLVGNHVRSISYSKRFDLIFVADESGFSIVKNGKIISFPATVIANKPRMTVTTMIEGKDYIYVCSHGNYVLKYYPKTNAVIPLGKNAHLSSLEMSAAIIQSNKDTILGLGRSGFSCYSDKRTDYENIGQIFDFAEDSQKNIWIAAWAYTNMKEPGGLFMFDGKNAVSYNKKYGIDSRGVWSVCFDKENNLLWVATEDKGVYCCSPSIFNVITPQQYNTDKLNVVDVLSLKSQLWVVTPTCIYAKKRECIITYKKALFEKAYKSSRVKANNDSLKRFTHIISDNKENIWILSNVGMFKICENSPIPKYYPVEYNEGECASVFDQNNVLYQTGWGYMNSFENIEENPKRKDYDKNYPVDINKVTKNGDELWFGSMNNGIYRFQNGKCWFFRKKQPYLAKCVTDIFVDKNKNIIYGGTNGMLYVAKFVGDTLQVRYSISKRDGLVGQSINWLKTSNNDTVLWISTNLGLNKLNLSKLLNENKKEITFYNSSEGFSNYSSSSSTTDENGNIITGSENGLIQINTSDFHQTKQPQLEVKLIGIDVNYNQICKIFPNNVDSWSHIPTNSIELKYNQNNINFEVGVINFINPDKDVFRYKLEGFNSQWTEFDKSNKISFTNLPAGTYRLCVESKNLNTGCNSKPLYFTFRIAKPFWATWWFRVAIVSLLIGFVLFYIRFRTKKIQKQEQLKTEIAKTIAEYEMKALQAQMNPHFIFNAMNSIQNYILDNDTDKALSYLSDFAKIIRLTLDHASKKWITLDEKIEYLNNYLALEQMRFRNKFDISIETNGLDPQSVLLPPMIIQPFVENAIKHGLTPAKYKGTLKVSFEQIQDSIICTIEDNGIGINRARELSQSNVNLHQSKGTEITAKRLELINVNAKIEISDLENKETNSSGTRVRVHLPLI